MSVRKLLHLSGVVVSAFSFAQSVGCARGDIVLGTGVATGTGWPSLRADDAGVAPAIVQQIPPPPAAATAVGQSPPSAATGTPATGRTVPPPTAASDEDAGAPPAVARPSAGCRKEPVQTQVSVSGQRASYLLDVPVAYDKRRAYPLVLAFRGTNMSTNEFRAQLRLAAIADALVVYPDPLDADTPWQFQRDMALVDELIDQLGAGYCVDRDRVFAIGNDAGALFANLVGCVRASQVRGIATLSSAPPPPGPCFGNTAVWLLQRTDLDPNTVGSGLGNRDFWATRNACDVLTPEPVAPAPCVEYAGCTPGLPVHFCEYAGSGWPSFAIAGAWSFFESL